MPRRLLVLFAHPVFERSRVNRGLVDAIADLPGVTFRDLYSLYPRFEIDVAAEQAQLLAHDVIVFQHPFYWYSTPSLMKEWQDLVLEHGWAYGRDGDALRGKITFNAVTTGGPAQAYRPDGNNRFTVRELLAPYEQTARLCGMTFLAPFVVHAALRLAEDAEVAPHGMAYRRLLEALRDERLDLAAAATTDNLHDFIQTAAATAHSTPATDTQR